MTDTWTKYVSRDCRARVDGVIEQLRKVEHPPFDVIVASKDEVHLILGRGWDDYGGTIEVRADGLTAVALIGTECKLRSWPIDSADLGDACEQLRRLCADVVRR